MSNLLLLSLLTVLPTPEDYVEYVNIVEVNSFYDEIGGLVFDQVIVRDNRNNIRQWELLENRTLDISDEQKKTWEEVEGKKFGMHRLPYLPPFYPRSLLVYKKDNKYHVWFQDKTTKQIYRVIANSFYYTHNSWHDVELIEREKFPKEFRIPVKPVIGGRELTAPMPPQSR